jgi:hypothetical protein
MIAEWWTFRHSLVNVRRSGSLQCAGRTRFAAVQSQGRGAEQLVAGVQRNYRGRGWFVVVHA